MCPAQHYELAPAMLASWAQQVGIPPERLLLVNLHGRNPLGHLEDRAQLAELLRRHRAEVLLVDPFGRAYTGRSQNDAGEVPAWLGELDRFAADAGVSELVLSVHAGWNGERTRGSSALEDWAHVIATLTRDPDDETARYLSAFGRDVDVDEDRLHFEPATRTLTLTGSGSRKRERAERTIEDVTPKVLEYVTEHPRCSGEDLRRGIAGTDRAIDRARHRLLNTASYWRSHAAGKVAARATASLKPRRTSANPGVPRLRTPAGPV